MKSLDATPCFDAHLHIIDHRFPLIANQGYLPPEFTVPHYRQRTALLNIVGGAVVSGSFQGNDQEYLLAALDALGESFVGVTQLPATVDDNTILRLSARRVRALRCNVFRGAAPDWKEITCLADRLWELARWHMEFYIDAASLQAALHHLECMPQIVIDHLGMSTEALPSLLQLAAKGAKIKATGFGRVQLDIAPTLKALADVNPGSLMFGTDLPSTRARRPFQDSDIDLIRNVLSPAQWQAALCDNAKTLYLPGFDTAAPPTPAQRLNHQP